MPSYIYNATTKELEYVAGGTLFADMPIGTIVPFGGSVIPNDYKLCDGSELLKTEYADLYAVIGDAFGTASDNTKFVLPDLRESVPKGAGLTGHTVGAHLDEDGLTVGEFLDDRIQEHTHTIQSISDSWSGTQGSSERYVFKTADLSTTYISGRTGATTEVKSVGVNFIIKALLTGQPVELSINTTDWNTIEELI